LSLAIIASERREFSGLLRHATDIVKLSWPVQFAVRAQMNGRPIVMLANGPGPKLAAEAAKKAGERLQKVDAFISTGYCGALDNGIRKLSIVIASHVNDRPTSRPATKLDYTAGPLLSQDAVACTVEEKSRLRKTGAIAVEMEAAGVEIVAREMGVPFYCVRVVTDAASEALALDFNQVRDRNGRFSRARILAAACRRPGRIVPELMKFERTSRSASLALGDFLANCRF
jgi:adenosylhomocysteine nucleosidase